jgi:hypothetical protein
MNIPSDYLGYIAIGALTLSFISLILLIRTQIRLKKLLRGKNAATLEDSIITIDNGLKDMYQFRIELEQYLEQVERRLKRSIQGVQTLRYNPFKGVGGGGNQSFATALINEKGDGVIISSLYARDHVSVYSKAIQNFKSEHELTEEEQEALKKAKESCK